MKANQLACSFLCLLLIFGLQGCGQKKDANSSEKISGAAATNNSASGSSGKTGKTYKITDPKTGTTLTVPFDSPPSESEIEKKFSEYYLKTFNETKARAEQGDAKAQNDLGACYDTGDGVAKDAVEAVKWWRKAAEQGDVEAQKSLTDAEAAVQNFQLLKTKAENGDARSQYDLGLCYAFGVGVATNEVEGEKWCRKAAEQYRKAAEQGDAKAQNDLGGCYYNGSGAAKDEVEAVKWFRKAAEQNYANAQYNLGICYHDGQGVVKDEMAAVRWYRKAAEQGNADAQRVLGKCFEDGDGVGKDRVQAYKWYCLAAAHVEDAHVITLPGGKQLAPPDMSGIARSYLSFLMLEMTSEQIKEAKQLMRIVAPAAEAKVEADIAADDRNQFAADKLKAEKGNRLDQVSLALDYDLGKGVPKDMTEAAKWYRKAAEQGDAFAQKSLGFMYQVGEGVPKNGVEAIKWYRMAAEQGNLGAECNLAAMYNNGDGVPQDYQEAAKWYRKAAEKNSADAQFKLGCCYHAGEGVPKDDAEAVKWFRKAADQGDTYAQYNLGFFYGNGEAVPKNYIEAFKWISLVTSHATPADFIRLQGISETPTARLAIINGVTVTRGENVSVKTRLGAVEIKCTSIEKDSVQITVEGEAKTTTLDLAPKSQSPSVFQRAFDMRAWLETRMTEEQIAEGQRLASEFKPRKQSKASPSDSNKDVDQLNPLASGTGFFITEDGFLITNEHVVKDAAKVRLVTSAGLISAKVVSVDAANDLALLKANGKFSPLPIVASRAVKLGGTVATVGFPNIGLQGFAPKLAKGEIASLSGVQDDPRYFQISVPVQPGNSGGALVDERGNVIGIVSAKLSARAALAASGALPENVNYAVKSSFLLSFLESVPAVSANLKEPISADRKFDDVVQSAQQAAVLVLVY